MALNNKKTPFGFDVEGRLERPALNKSADTDTYTDTHTYTDKKETKSKRLYLLAKPSVHQKLDEYAKAKGDTFNNLVHTLMEEFIDKHNL